MAVASSLHLTFARLKINQLRCLEGFPRVLTKVDAGGIELSRFELPDSL